MDKEDNTIYASTLYWKAVRAESKAEKAWDELNKFVSKAKIDLTKYIHLTEQITE